jgi:glycosyl transferase family 25
MKAFVINLERAKDRRRHILRQLEKHKLDYEFIDAVDGKQMGQEEIEQLCDLEEVKRRPQKLTVGALGCALSHYKAHQKILNENLDMALVLEDDMVFLDSFKDVLEEIKNHIETNEVVLLHYFSSAQDQKLIISRQEAVPLSRKWSLMYPVDIPQSGGAYVITKEVAQSLVETRLPIRVEADDWQFYYENKFIQSIRCVYPFIVRTSFAPTQIQLINPNAQRKIPLRHKAMNFVNNTKIPILYPLLHRYQDARFEHQPHLIRLVDEPSLIGKI